jgi:hypothetical protein
MPRICSQLRTDRSGAAAAEMALVLPLLLVIMFGAAEMGNYFMNQHAVVKTVRDGARFAARLQLQAEDYACVAGDTDDIWEADDAVTQIENVVKYGTVDDSGTGRFGAAAWEDPCTGEAGTIDVDVRCVDPAAAELQGIYAGLVGEIPVVTVSAAVPYQPILSAVGVNLAGTCLRAESEAAVTGL